MAIIHTSIPRGSYAILQSPLPDESDTDFDRAAMDILWRGDEKSLRAAFPKGSTTNYPTSLPAGARMVCAGVRVTRSRFGFLWARVEWMGLLNPSSPIAFGGGTVTIGATPLAVKTWTNNATTYELDLPIEVDGTTVVGLAPFNGTGPAARTRQRVIHPGWGMTLEGVMIVNRNQPPQRPKLNNFPRPTGLPDDFNKAAANSAAHLISRANWFKEINTAVGGWCVRDFQAPSPVILGTQLLVRWTLRAEWIDRFSPS